MGKFEKSGMIFLIGLLFLIGCNVEPKQEIASFSDLMITTNPQTEEINYAVNKRLKYLNIHCTASKGELSKEWLLNFFKNERGWSKPGYNLVVHMDGSIDTLVPFNSDGYVSYDEISYGVRGRNSESINVAYTGGVDASMNPKDTRTNAQKHSLAYVVAKLRCQNPDIIVMGHRNHKGVAKACPSFDVQKEFYEPGVSPSSLFDSVLDSIPSFDTLSDSL